MLSIHAQRNPLTVGCRKKCALQRTPQWALWAIHKSREYTDLVASKLPSCKLAVSSPNALDMRTYTYGKNLEYLKV